MTRNTLADFKKTIISLYKEEGKVWLKGLPGLINQIEDTFKIEIQDPFPKLSINYTTPAKFIDGEEVVVKLGIPSNKEFKTEVEALKLFNGKGMVKLLEVDLEKGLMILEYLKPGTNIEKMDEEEAMSITTALLKKFWIKAPERNIFPKVSDWGKGFKKYKNSKSTLLDKKLVDKAEKIFFELEASQGEQFLLHGDFHHGNILKAEREAYLTIDPKGVIGEREYEIGALLRNPYPQILEYPDIKVTIKNRIGFLSERLGLDPKRVYLWSFSQAVLATIWVVENFGEGWDKWNTVAEILEEVKI
ncbi:fructosamine kinase family protein [Candidatus Daviesbacteria bacterium]|nr:fructosamine kinase family protein [Candidatus Daviesbacteria bacterium]